MKRVSQKIKKKSYMKQSRVTDGQHNDTVDTVAQLATDPFYIIVFSD